MEWLIWSSVFSPMQPMKSLNGYCFSFNIKKWPNKKSLTHSWSQVAERKRNTHDDVKCRVHNATRGWGMTLAPARRSVHGTLYYEDNPRGPSLTWINLQLKVFSVHLNLHKNMQWVVSFESVFFCSLVFIERFHKVARLHWSMTETRAGADGERVCEFSGWEEPLVLRQATHLLKKCTNCFSYPPPPKKKKGGKKNLTKPT